MIRRVRTFRRQNLDEAVVKSGFEKFVGNRCVEKNRERGQRERERGLEKKWKEQENCNFRKRNGRTENCLFGLQDNIIITLACGLT